PGADRSLRVPSAAQPVSPRADNRSTHSAADIRRRANRWPWPRYARSPAPAAQPAPRPSWSNRSSRAAWEISVWSCVLQGLADDSDRQRSRQDACPDPLVIIMTISSAGTLGALRRDRGIPGGWARLRRLRCRLRGVRGRRRVRLGGCPAPPSPQEPSNPVLHLGTERFTELFRGDGRRRITQRPPGYLGSGTPGGILRLLDGTLPRHRQRLIARCGQVQRDLRTLYRAGNPQPHRHTTARTGQGDRRSADLLTG